MAGAPYIMINIRILLYLVFSFLLSHFGKYDKII